MTRAVLLLVAVLGASAMAQNKGGPRATNAVLLLDQNAPTVNPNLTSKPDGTSTAVPGAMHLTGCMGYRITVCAPTNATLSGAGALDVYYWPDKSTVPVMLPWSRNPGVDETITVTSASCRLGNADVACQCQTMPDRTTAGMNAGWIYVAPDGVTISGGLTVTVTVEAVCSQ